MRSSPTVSVIDYSSGKVGRSWRNYLKPFNMCKLLPTYIHKLGPILLKSLKNPPAEVQCTRLSSPSSRASSQMYTSSRDRGDYPCVRRNEVNNLAFLVQGYSNAVASSLELPFRNRSFETLLASSLRISPISIFAG